jgi:hypothetical protein
MNEPDMTGQSCNDLSRAPDDKPGSPFADAARPEPAAAAASSGEPANPHYTLASLLLMITLIGVFLGVCIRAPSAGAIVAFLALPALVRTVLLNARRKARGRSMSFSEKVFTFAKSLGVVVFIASISGGILGVIIFGVIGERGLGRMPGWALFWVLVGICTSGLVGVGLLRWLWLPDD